MKMHELYDESWKDFDIKIRFIPVFIGTHKEKECGVCRGTGRQIADVDDYYFAGFLPATENCWMCRGKGTTKKDIVVPEIPDDLHAYMKKAFNKFFKDKEKKFQ